MTAARGITAIDNGNTNSPKNYLFISSNNKPDNFNELLKNMRKEKPVLNLNRKVERGFMTSLKPILA